MKILASGPITSWQIDGETVETVTDFIFVGSKISADSDCSHEIKRHYLLGIKVMTNLYSILKSRDITLLTKFHLVKAMVFPVVMYGWESWTIKKAEYQRCFWTIVLEKTLESLLDCKDIKPVNSEEINPNIDWKDWWWRSNMMWWVDSMEKTLMLGKIEGRRRRGWQSMRWLDGIIDLKDMSLSKLWEIVKDREARHAAVHGVTKRHTRLSDWTTAAANYSLLFPINNPRKTPIPPPRYLRRSTPHYNYLCAYCFFYSLRQCLRYFT